MKTGLSLTEMAQELERQAGAKRDFVADTRRMVVAPDLRTIALANGDPNKSLGQFGINPYAHRQLAEALEVPAKFYDRMKEKHPDLLADTLNGLLQREPARRMVRTLDNNVRAFLSDRYRPLDNLDLAQAVLPKIAEFPGADFISQQFTEERFYLKVVFPGIQTEVKRGDVVQAGLVISNSEVGAGSVQVAPLVYRLVCLNGMIAQDYGQKRYHVGKRVTGTEEAFEMFSDRTRQLDDAAFWSKVQDTVVATLKQDVFEKIVGRMRDATEQRIEGKVEEVVELTAQRFGYGENTKAGVLKHLIEGGDLSRYGLLNAITRQSQDESDYSVATQLEADGFRVIELPRSDWRQIAEAA